MNDQVRERLAVSGAVECMERIQQAISAHDLEALTDCFEEEYQSIFPVHPDRAFTGHAQMRKNWSQIFSTIPDIQATLIRCNADGDTVWSEWEWRGTRPDGAVYLQRGVTIQGVPRGRIQWVRLYIEPVEEADGGMDVAVRQSTTGSSSS